MSAALHVVFRVGEAEYAIAASDVATMDSFEGCTRVPGTSPWVAGLVQVRGDVMTLVDLRARFGLAPSEDGLDTRIIVVNHGRRRIGLKVDLAREIVALDSAQFAAPPEEVERAAARFVRAVAKRGPRLLMVIDPARIVSEEELDAEQRNAGA